jgi:hypothetical protein
MEELEARLRAGEEVEYEDMEGLDDMRFRELRRRTGFRDTSSGYAI